jgi:hypothetical protein
MPVKLRFDNVLKAINKIPIPHFTLLDTVIARVAGEGETVNK